MKILLLSILVHCGVGKGKTLLSESAASPINENIPFVHTPGLLWSIFSAVAFFTLYLK